MKYVKVSWFDHKPTDNNNGLIFGIQDNTDFPEYVEWFKTEQEREQHIKDNNLEVIE